MAKIVTRSPRQVLKMAQLYEGGKSTLAVGKVLGISDSLVLRTLRAAGVKIRTLREAQELAWRDPELRRTRSAAIARAAQTPEGRHRLSVFGRLPKKPRGGRLLLAEASDRLRRGEPVPSRCAAASTALRLKRLAAASRPVKRRRRKRSPWDLVKTPKVKIRPDIHRRFLAVLARANVRAAEERAMIIALPVQGDDDWVGSPIGFNSQIG